MLARSLGMFASLALAANAVLIPPSVAGVDSLVSEEIWGSDPWNKYIAIECDSCPRFFKNLEGKGFKEDNETVLYVSRTSDARSGNN